MARRNLRNIDQRILHRIIAEGAAKGIEGISTKKIASLLRISEPTIYIHFQTKENLLKEAYQSALETLFLSADFSSSEDLDVLIPRVFVSLGQQAQVHPDEARYVFAYSHRPGSEESETKTNPAVDAIVHAFRTGWNQGGCDEGNALIDPSIDRLLDSYTFEMILAFVDSIAKKNGPTDEVTAVFYGSLLLSSIQNGKGLFEKWSRKSQ